MSSTAIAVLLAVPFILPFAYLVVRNAGDLGGLWAVISNSDTIMPAFRSLLLGTSVAIATGVIGTGAAWMVARTDLSGRRTWALLLCLPLVMPSFVGAVALIAAFSPGGLLDQMFGNALPLRQVHGFWGAFVVLTLLTYPYVFLPVMARLRTMAPSTEESARLLGRRPFSVFLTVVVPQARAAIAAGALLVFLYVISDFGAVQLLRYDTLTRMIYANRLLDPSVSMALSLVLGVIAIAIVMFERRASRVGLRESQRLRTPLTVPLGRLKALSVTLLSLLVTLSLVTPIGVLCIRAIRGVIQGNDRPNSVINDPSLLVGPLASTAGVSIATAIIATIVMLPIAYRTVRRPGRLGEAIAGTVVGGFALPGLITALALSFWTLASPGPIGALYQTLPLLVLAYLVHHGALALGASQTAVAGIPQRLEDAARNLGSGRIRRLFTIELPLMWPGIAAGAGLVLLSTMKELPATLLLSPPGFTTLATRIWSTAEVALYEDAAIYALVLVALSAILTWFLVVRPALRSWNNVPRYVPEPDASQIPAEPLVDGEHRPRD